jgi:hypothetical protein
LVPHFDEWYYYELCASSFFWGLFIEYIFNEIFLEKRAHCCQWYDYELCASSFFWGLFIEYIFNESFFEKKGSMLPMVLL